MAAYPNHRYQLNTARHNDLQAVMTHEDAMMSEQDMADEANAHYIGTPANASSSPHIERNGYIDTDDCMQFDEWPNNEQHFGDMCMQFDEWPKEQHVGGMWPSGGDDSFNSVSHSDEMHIDIRYPFGMG